MIVRFKNTKLFITNKFKHVNVEKTKIDRQTFLWLMFKKYCSRCIRILRKWHLMDENVFEMKSSLILNLNLKHLTSEILNDRLWIGN